MAISRRYIWILVIIGIIFLSVVIILIFILINKCISRREKHSIAQLQRGPVIKAESNKYQETYVVISTPPLPPRTQFQTADAQSYENLAEAHDYVPVIPDDEQDVNDYEEAVPDVNNYEEPLPEENDYEEAVPDVNNYEEPLPDVNNYEEPLPDVNNYEEPLPEENDYEEAASDVTNYEEPLPDVNDYEEALPDYEQDRNDYKQALPECEQNMNDCTQALFGYSKNMVEQAEEELFPPPPRYGDPDAETGYTSTEDYDDVGGEDEDQDEDYDDVA